MWSTLKDAIIHFVPTFHCFDFICQHNFFHSILFLSECFYVTKHETSRFLWCFFSSLSSFEKHSLLKRHCRKFEKKNTVYVYGNRLEYSICILTFSETKIRGMMPKVAHKRWISRYFLTTFASDWEKKNIRNRPILLIGFATPPQKFVCTPMPWKKSIFLENTELRNCPWSFMLFFTSQHFSQTFLFFYLF